MGALLEIREPDTEPRQFLAQDGMTFGRSPQNHCVLLDATAGTHHFRIVKAQNGLEVEDLGSRNKTEIGGVGFLKKGERQALVPGLVFRAGKTVFSVKEIQGTGGSGTVDAECRATALVNSFRSLVSEPLSTEKESSGESSDAALVDPVPPTDEVDRGEASALESAAPAASEGPPVAAGGSAPPVASAWATFEKLRPRLVVACRGLQQITDLREPTVTIGRGESADIRINHPHVAEEHASIFFDGRNFTVEALSSEHEIVVGGDVLPSGPPRVITSETPLVFGSVDTLFVVEQGSGSADSARQQRAAKMLLAAKKISSFDYKEALRQAGPEGRHVGEMLLRDSDLCVNDWCAALQDVSNGGGAGSRSLTVVIAVGALAVIALLVYLFVF